MLTSTFLAVGLTTLSLAAPQYQTGSHSGLGSHDHDVAESSSSSGNSDYGAFIGAHAYYNEDADDWSAGKTSEFPIMFCNHSETAMIKQGLREAEILAAHARDHIHRWGNSSSFYKKYFGRAATAEPAGWYDKIVNVDKTGVIFRCDDPDGNCANNETWAGHWRGENGTDETVICAPSYSQRWRLEELCMHGYTVAGSPYSQYWASDLHHRLYHTIKVGEGIVDHYADDYGPSLELAVDAPEEAVRNSQSLSLFALDVYAFDVAVPNAGCTGEYVAEDTEEGESSRSVTSSSSMALNTSPAPAEATADASSAAEDYAVTTTTSSGEHCHTHADTGEEHCS